MLWGPIYVSFSRIRKDVNACQPVWTAGRIIFSTKHDLNAVTKDKVSLLQFIDFPLKKQLKLIISWVIFILMLCITSIDSNVTIIGFQATHWKVWLSKQQFKALVLPHIFPPYLGRKLVPDERHLQLLFIYSFILVLSHSLEKDL